MSVVPTCVQDPPSHGPPPQIGNVYQTSWFILSVLFLPGGPYRCDLWSSYILSVLSSETSPITQTSTLQ